jgi:hypothetical protein
VAGRGRGAGLPEVRRHLSFCTRAALRRRPSGIAGDRIPAGNAGLEVAHEPAVIQAHCDTPDEAAPTPIARVELPHYLARFREMGHCSGHLSWPGSFVVEHLPEVALVDSLATPRADEEVIHLVDGLAPDPLPDDAARRVVRALAHRSLQ